MRAASHQQIAQEWWEKDRHRHSVYVSEFVLIEAGRGDPEAARADALHIAFACFYEMDYLLTLTCRHIAHGAVMRRLRTVNERSGRHTPLIVTPLELVGPELELPDV